MSQAKLFCDGLGSGWSYIVKSLLRRKPKHLVKQSDYITKITNMLMIKGRPFDTINFTDLSAQLEQRCLGSNNLAKLTKG